MPGLWGLRGKLMLAISLPIALIGLFITLYFPSRQEEGAGSMMRARILTFADVVAHQVTIHLDASLDPLTGEIDPLLDRVTTVFSEDLMPVTRDEELAYIAVVVGSKVVARHEAADVVEPERYYRQVTAAVAEESEELLHAWVPIMKEEIGTDRKLQLGTLAVGFSRQALTELRSSSQTAALLLASAMFVLGFFIAWFVSRRIGVPLREASSRLTSVSNQLVSAARAREASAAEEAAAVTETRRLMDMLLNTVQKIADSASVVLGNAERTLDGNREISDRIFELNEHAEKVAEILASIMHVADRTDLLALNAALEGTKAGKAGKGFTLVAKEMRRLAESVMESVEGIRRLMSDVREASQHAVESSRSGTEFSEETTRSVREIALHTQQQRKATEQVSRAMDEMTELISHAMADIKGTTRSAASLADLAQVLSDLIEHRSDNGQGNGRGKRGAAAKQERGTA